MNQLEAYGWLSTIFLWISLLPENRFYLHILGLLASIGRLSYILYLYMNNTGDFARPLIANWIVTIFIHVYCLYRFRNLAFIKK